MRKTQISHTTKASGALANRRLTNTKIQNNKG